MQNIFSLMQKLRRYKLFEMLRSSLWRSKIIASELWLHGAPRKGHK
jgi:hypothetical protein